MSFTVARDIGVVLIKNGTVRIVNIWRPWGIYICFCLSGFFRIRRRRAKVSVLLSFGACAIFGVVSGLKSFLGQGINTNASVIVTSVYVGRLNGVNVWCRVTISVGTLIML